MADSGGNIIDAYAKVVVRAWKEPAFKRQLLAEPVAALAEMDIAAPAGKTINMVENTDQVRNLILPAPPSETGPSDDALEKAAIAAVLDAGGGVGSNQGLGGFHGSFDD